MLCLKDGPDSLEVALVSNSDRSAGSENVLKILGLPGPFAGRSGQTERHSHRPAVFKGRELTEIAMDTNSKYRYDTPSPDRLYTCSG